MFVVPFVYLPCQHVTAGAFGVHDVVVENKGVWVAGFVAAGSDKFAHRWSP